MAGYYCRSDCWGWRFACGGKFFFRRKLALRGSVGLIFGGVACLGLAVNDDDRLVEYVPVIKQWHHNVPELVDAPSLNTPEFRRSLARQLTALGMPYQIGDGGFKDTSVLNSEPSSGVGIYPERDWI